MYLMIILVKRLANHLVSSTITKLLSYNITIVTFYTQDFSLVQEDDGSIMVQCVYAISTE